jgi:hypothetical protein
VGSAAGTVGDAAQTVGHAVKAVAAPVATAVVGAAAGVLGGVVLGRTRLNRKKKVLGVTLPGQKDGVEHLAKNVGEAGKQFGKLAGEVRAARQKAEQIGKALT